MLVVIHCVTLCSNIFDFELRLISWGFLAGINSFSRNHINDRFLLDGIRNLQHNQFYDNEFEKILSKISAHFCWVRDLIPQSLNDFGVK